MVDSVMKYAQIVNHKVINVIEADSQEIAEMVSSDCVVIQSDECQIDWIHDEELGLRDNPRPSFNKLTHKAETEEVENQVPQWVISELSNEEKEKINNDAAKNVRSERQFLLSETDFYGMPDVVMSDEMAAYRQSLRDITLQDGFPHEMEWPEKP
tara:strand:+ start:23 stop:487 length:465 start_codon:yes stop_codon:yes gene_type:complete